MEDTNIKCGVEIRCYDYMTRPCVLSKDHSGGHNPFSNIAYDSLDTNPARVEMQVVEIVPIKVEKPMQIEIQNCLWSDAHGMCIYQLGHKGQHKSLGDRGDQ